MTEEHSGADDEEHWAGDHEPLRIRTARPVDAEQVVRLLSQLGYPTDARAVARRVEHLETDERQEVLVADQGGDVVGLVVVDVAGLIHRDEPTARITALAVHDDLRGQGHGRALVDEAERIAREAGCLEMLVTSGRRAERAGAHAFYRYLGYGDDCERSAYFVKDLAG